MREIYQIKSFFEILKMKMLLKTERASEKMNHEFEQFAFT